MASHLHQMYTDQTNTDSMTSNEQKSNYKILHKDIVSNHDSRQSISKSITKSLLRWCLQVKEFVLLSSWGGWHPVSWRHTCSEYLGVCNINTQSDKRVRAGRLDMFCNTLIFTLLSIAATVSLSFWCFLTLSFLITLTLFLSPPCRSLASPRWDWSSPSRSASAPETQPAPPLHFSPSSLHLSPISTPPSTSMIWSTAGNLL